MIFYRRTVELVRESLNEFLNRKAGGVTERRWLEGSNNFMQFFFCFAEFDLEFSKHLVLFAFSKQQIVIC